MTRAWVAAAAAALALATFFWFPGHTWLQQDTQIYVPILEHQRDGSVLRNDLIAQHPHDAFTLYDEVAIGLRAVTRLGFREVLAAQQIVTRALGIWGLLLLAEAFGLGVWEAFAVAAICSLGVVIAGPTVLTLEYEPTPRAFAVPLVMLAIGLAARRKWLGASAAASIAFLYHAPTTLPFWAVFGVVVLLRREWRALAPIAFAAAVLLASATAQGEPAFYGRLTAAEEQLQRMRASYVWVSMWPAAWVVHWLIVMAVAAAAFWRVRGKAWILGAMAVIGLATMPLSWLLLERMKWALVPQVQPMRALLFTGLAMQFFAAVAAFKVRRWWEAAAWFFAAYVLVVQPVLTEPWAWRAVAVVAVLSVASAWRSAAAIAMAVAAFVAIPVAGGVVNYPKQHTPELAQVSAWARASTSKDAVFLFPDARRGVEPGIFRSEALRAVYVDWKGGGQVNYVRGFGEEWWFRWQQTMVPKFSRAMLAKYNGLGIGYVVVQRKNALPMGAAFENSAYVVYSTKRD
jgi:hypothetical protein